MSSATFVVFAGGPANKATGSIIRGKGAPSWVMEFTAHESVVMGNGKNRPAKGMATAYHIYDSNKYWAMDIECVKVIDEVNAVFAGQIVVESGMNWNVGNYMRNWIEDNGEPGVLADVSHSGITDSWETAMLFCSDPPDNPNGFKHHWTVFEGNIQVHYRATD